MINIREPSDTFDSNEFLSIFIDTAACCILWIIIRNIEFPISRMDGISKPDFIILKEGENLFVGNRIHITKDNKLLLAVHNPSPKIAELIPPASDASRTWRKLTDTYVVIRITEAFNGIWIVWCRLCGHPQFYQQTDSIIQ